MLLWATGYGHQEVREPRSLQRLAQPRAVCRAPPEAAVATPLATPGAGHPAGSFDERSPTAALRHQPPSEVSLTPYATQVAVSAGSQPGPSRDAVGSRLEPGCTAQRLILSGSAF